MAHLRGLVCLSALALACACSGLAQSPQRTEARQDLSQIHQLHVALLRKPAAERTAAAYDHLLAMFPPLWKNSKDPAADAARYAAASLYVEKARTLNHHAAYVKASQTLRDLLRVSPYTAYRRNAEFALAQIEIYHINDASGARYWLRDFVRRYPADPRVSVARREIAGRHIPEPAFMVASDPLPALPSAAPPRLVLPPAAPPAAPPPAARAADQAAARSRQWQVHIGNIQGLQVFTNPHASSVVVSLGRKVHFTSGALPKRHIVYFDVSSQGASAAAASGSARFNVSDGRVVSIRVAEFNRRATRIVIEMDPGVRSNQGGFYPNPDRLIIALTGAHAHAATDVTPPPAAIPAAPARPAQPLANGRDSLTRALGLKIHRIVIVAGHGGHDTGTIGAGNLDEKSVVLDVALRLGKLLQQRMGMDVIYTRSTDVFIPLQKRTQIANAAHADLFISIHANSSPSVQTRGVETYYLNFTRDPRALAVAARENAGTADGIHDLPHLLQTIALNNKLEESRELAADVQHSLAQATGEENRGVKTAPFVVLIGAQMPSILAEISFLSNRTDDHRLRTAAYRQRIAEGLYRGLRSYILSLSGTTTAALAGDAAAAGRPR